MQASIEQHRQGIDGKESENGHEQGEGRKVARRCRLQPSPDPTNTLRAPLDEIVHSLSG
jgi:hypothetical protein